MKPPSAPARKYMFETEFAADGTIVRDARENVRRYSAEDIEAERAISYARGQKDAVVAAERALTEALRECAAAVHGTLAKLNADQRAMRAEAAKVALAAARKIAGAALDQFGEARVLGAIEAAMETLRHGPRLVVKVAPDLVEGVRTRLAPIVEENFYAGAILVRGAAGMRGGDASIEWADGLIEIDNEEAQRRLEALIVAALAETAE